MKTEWIVIEMTAVLIDGLTKVYFLSSRYTSKYKSIAPQLLALACFVGWGTCATLNSFPTLFYDSMDYMLVLVYLILTKQSSFMQKLFGWVMTIALAFSSSLAGAGLASLISNVNMEHTLLYQDSARLLAIIFIKTFQVVLFYGLAKKHYNLRGVQKKPVIVLTCAALIVFVCLLFLFVNISDFNEQSNFLLIWLAIGLLFILIGIFILYEMFIREEVRNIDLTTRLQRLELETHFFKELEIMLNDLRTWRHEYKNNLVALHALINDGSSEKMLDYLEKMSIETFRETAMLQTGNTVLDAVVSSKLMLAHSKGIDVNIHAVYPEINTIEDNDLCAIAGNLLDNAIEACERMGLSENLRFISFSLLVKSRNLMLSIVNSYEGNIKRVGDKILTIKENEYHGIGIRYVDSLVDKYKGYVLREYQNGIFETHVMLPLIKDGKSK